MCQMCLLDLTKLLGKLTSTVIAVLPAPLHYRQVQRDQIKNLLREKELLPVSNISFKRGNWGNCNGGSKSKSLGSRF